MRKDGLHTITGVRSCVTMDIIILKRQIPTVSRRQNLGLDAHDNDHNESVPITLKSQYRIQMLSNSFILHKLHSHAYHTSCKGAFVLEGFCPRVNVHDLNRSRFSVKYCPGFKSWLNCMCTDYWANHVDVVIGLTRCLPSRMCNMQYQGFAYLLQLFGAWNQDF